MPANDGSIGRALMQFAGVPAEVAVAIDKALNDAGLGGDPVKQSILDAATAGQNSGWLPLSPTPEILQWALDTGGSAAGFSIDVSADGVNALAQTHTGTATSSVTAERYWFVPTHPQAKFFRVTVLSGGPMSMQRGA